MLRLEIQTTVSEFQLRVNAEVSLSDATALIGPNGSGKTTLLRSVVGLVPTRGKIFLDSECWFDSETQTNLPAHRRPVGYVSQSPILLPHLSIESNLKFAQSLSKSKRNQAFAIPLDEVVSSLDLKELLKRKPDTLSGGETSRVALAQALISRPSILLLDEPLASIDFDRKAELMPYLKAILQRYEVPMLFVSHSLSEVAALCEQTLVLRDGVVEEQGETSEVLQQLDTFDMVDDQGVVIHATAIDYDAEFQLTRLSFCHQELMVPSIHATEADQVKRLRIRSRDVTLATARPDKISVRNILRGKVCNIELTPASPFVQVGVNCGGEIIQAQVTRAAVMELALVEGMDVYALVKSVTMEL